MATRGRWQDPARSVERMPLLQCQLLLRTGGPPPAHAAAIRVGGVPFTFGRFNYCHLNPSVMKQASPGKRGGSWCEVQTCCGAGVGVHVERQHLPLAPSRIARAGTGGGWVRNEGLRQEWRELGQMSCHLPSGVWAVATRPGVSPLVHTQPLHRGLLSPGRLLLLQSIASPPLDKPTSVRTRLARPHCSAPHCTTHIIPLECRIVPGPSSTRMCPGTGCTCPVVLGRGQGAGRMGTRAALEGPACRCRCGRDADVPVDAAVGTDADVGVDAAVDMDADVDADTVVGTDANGGMDADVGTNVVVGTDTDVAADAAMDIGGRCGCRYNCGHRCRCGHRSSGHRCGCGHGCRCGHRCSCGHWMQMQMQMWAERQVWAGMQMCLQLQGSAAGCGDREPALIWNAAGWWARGGEDTATRGHGRHFRPSSVSCGVQPAALNC
ncbi:uncharacterized protein LOC129736159 [Falco cherrug]|uniref:uncharacterized protein LOC129736159 n=1 Tax=Falco cherrug TaxID=345164 RepID=UPI00247915C8|nr:uncharacterized protein LOC129736159 [Falco cherrug]